MSGGQRYTRGGRYMGGVYQRVGAGIPEGGDGYVPGHLTWDTHPPPIIDT